MTGPHTEHIATASSTWIVVGPDKILGATHDLQIREGTDGSNYFDRRVVRRDT